MTLSNLVTYTNYDEAKDLFSSGLSNRKWFIKNLHITLLTILKSFWGFIKIEQFNFDQETINRAWFRPWIIKIQIILNGQSTKIVLLGKKMILRFYFFV